MQNINVVTITGNLTRDPELRKTWSGMSVTRLRVAVNGSRKTSQGEWVDKPNFFDVTVWGARGEAVATYLSKGRAVAITGRLDWHEWETEDGGKRQGVEIVADAVQFLPGGQRAEDEEARSEEQPVDAPDADAVPVPAGVGAGDEDEIQF